MRILIAGHRFWLDPPRVAANVRRLIERYDRAIAIVHGGATGVHEAFAMAAKGPASKSRPFR